MVQINTFILSITPLVPNVTIRVLCIILIISTVFCCNLSIKLLLGIDENVIQIRCHRLLYIERYIKLLLL